MFRLFAMDGVLTPMLGHSGTAGTLMEFYERVSGARLHAAGIIVQGCASKIFRQDC